MYFCLIQAIFRLAFFLCCIFFRFLEITFWGQSEKVQRFFGFSDMKG